MQAAMSNGVVSDSGEEPGKHAVHADFVDRISGRRFRGRRVLRTFEVRTGRTHGYREPFVGLLSRRPHGAKIAG
jgi:hypothetical protein